MMGRGKKRLQCGPCKNVSIEGGHLVVLEAVIAGKKGGERRSRTVAYGSGCRKEN